MLIKLILLIAQNQKNIEKYYGTSIVKQSIPALLKDCEWWKFPFLYQSILRCYQYVNLIFIKMKKLTDKQKEALAILRKYPDAIIMDNGYITGGHGCIDSRIAKALKRKGYIEVSGERRDRLSELGKTCALAD